MVENLFLLLSALYQLYTGFSTSRTSREKPKHAKLHSTCENCRKQKIKCLSESVGDVSFVSPKSQTNLPQSASPAKLAGSSRLNPVLDAMAALVRSAKRKAFPAFISSERAACSSRTKEALEHASASTSTWVTQRLSTNV